MPTKPAHPCRYPGCPALVQGKEAYCHEHQQHAVMDDRPSASERGYGHRWRKLRLMQLRMYPLCADPFGVHAERNEIIAATDVDHIVPRSRGGQDVLDNLQSLCHACHSKKTATQDGGGWRGRGE